MISINSNLQQNDIPSFGKFYDNKKILNILKNSKKSNLKDLENTQSKTTKKTKEESSSEKPKLSSETLKSIFVPSATATTVAIDSQAKKTVETLKPVEQTRQLELKTKAFDYFRTGIFKKVPEYQQAG